jgi:DNA repair exonuclease SbcCD ATPase subunit
MFGGFHPHDVVNYISKKTREYREELEALRSGADKLRRERDTLLAEQDKPPADFPPEPVYVPVVAAPPAPPPDNTALDELRAQLDERRVQFYEMCRERDGLRSKLEALTQAQEAGREAMESFERERDAFEGDRASLMTALTRREEEKAELANERAAWFAEKAELIDERKSLLLAVEQAGASREQMRREEEESARRLEDVKAQAANVRQETAKLIAQSRAFFDEMNEKSRASALEIVLELDRMRAFFARFPERFADPGQILSKLESDPRPHMREFKPQVFEQRTVNNEQLTTNS